MKLEAYTTVGDWDILRLKAVFSSQTLALPPRLHHGPGCSVGIATSYGLDGPGIESRWGEILRTCPDRPCGPPCSSSMGTGSFPGVKSGRGVTLTPHPLLVPWSRKGRAIPLLLYRPYDLYRASVPVQGCTLPYDLYRASVPVQGCTLPLPYQGSIKIAIQKIVI
jgi:hypothetical protein